MLDKLLHNNKGQMMVEAMIAITISVIGLLGIFSFLSQSLGLNRTVVDQYIGAYLAAEGIELVKNLADAQTAWGNVAECAACQLDFDDTDLSDFNPNSSLRFDSNSGIYSYDTGDPTAHKRKIAISYPEPDIMKVISLVTWTGRGGGEFKVELEDFFFNLSQ